MKLNVKISTTLNGKSKPDFIGNLKKITAIYPLQIGMLHIVMNI
jgi:hypothetical protein